MAAEERRLVAEEGSYSLNTWLLKREDGGRLGELRYRAPASRQPPGGQDGELQYRAHPTDPSVSTTGTGVVGVGYLWILLIHEPPEPAVLYFFPGRGPKTGSRRRIVFKEDLAAEDFGGRRAPVQGPANLLVKSVLLSPTKDKLHQKLYLRRLAEEDTKMGVLTALLSFRLNNYRFSTEL